MAKERDGSINIYGSLQAKTEDGYVAYTDGIAHENEDGTTTSLDQLLADGVGGIIDVDKLPLTGTLLVSNPETMVNKVIFNDKLSIEETIKILSQLTYYNFNGMQVNALYSNATGTSAIIVIKNSDTDYRINHFTNVQTKTYTRIFSSVVVDEVVGWFNTEYEINQTGVTSLMGLPIGIENEKLKELVSMNDGFTINGNDKAIYRLKENILIGYKGTTVPNSGVLEKLYFNTSLTSDEVSNILNNLTWINASNLGQSGFEFYPVLAYMNGSYPYVLAFKRFTESTSDNYAGEIHIGIINFATMLTIQNFFISSRNGWETFDNPYTINATLLSELSGIPLGTQNDLISSLISTTLFEKEYETKYTYWVYKDKFEQLIDENSLTNENTIIEKTSAFTNFTFEDITLTSEELSKAINSENCILIISLDNNAKIKYYFKKVTSYPGFVEFIGHNGVISEDGTYIEASPLPMALIFTLNNLTGQTKYGELNLSSFNYDNTSSGMFFRLNYILNGKTLHRKINYDYYPTKDSNAFVSSRGIYERLQGKQDTLEFDTIPTSGSTNTVTSGGVYTALQTKQNKITVTENDDGTVDITIPTE